MSGKETIVPVVRPVNFNTSRASFPRVSPLTPLQYANCSYLFPRRARPSKADRDSFTWQITGSYWSSAVRKNSRASRRRRSTTDSGKWCHRSKNPRSETSELSPKPLSSSVANSSATRPKSFALKASTFDSSFPFSDRLDGGQL